jgi:nucleoid-associated protein Lsr2
MSVKTHRYRVDDLEHARDPNTEILAVRTHRLALDRTEVDIDLSEENERRLLKRLLPYLEVGRPVSSRRQQSRSVPDRRRSAEIREWAKSRGIKVHARGRIPVAIVAQYEDSGDGKA